MIDFDAYKQSSMLYWWPKIKDLDIPQPRTEYVNVSDSALIKMIDGEAPVPNIDEIKRMVEKFDMPVFLRGADTSGKHSWKNTCYLDDIEQLGQHVYNLAEDALLKDINIRAIFAREFVKMNLAGFTAFLGDMPISREVRCFIDGGKKVCQHWYWFEEAVDNHGYSPKDPDWKEKLAKNNTMTEADQLTINNYLLQVCEVLGGSWSVDFCQGADGTWWLIDCARGEASYHYPHESDATKTQNGEVAPDELVGMDDDD